MTRAKFTITVPVSQEGEEAFNDAIIVAVAAAGGCTTTGNLGGEWVAPEGRILELVREHSFLADETNFSYVEHSVKEVARALLAQGEQAVLVQHWINGSFGFNLYTKENLQ